MIILLQGGSKMARAVIAAKFAEKHDGWQHLPAEEVNAATSAMGFDLFSEPSVLAMLACTCASEIVEKDKVNLIITCGDDLPILKNFQDEFKKGVSVHLRSKKSVLEDDEFDKVLEPATSADKAVKALEELIQK
jgi:hypothetical protein